jgi:hypothetical protein
MKRRFVELVPEFLELAQYSLRHACDSYSHSNM